MDRNSHPGGNKFMLIAGISVRGIKNKINLKKMGKDKNTT